MVLDRRPEAHSSAKIFGDANPPAWIGEIIDLKKGKKEHFENPGNWCQTAR